MKTKNILFLFPSMALLAGCGEIPENIETESFVLDFNASYIQKDDSSNKEKFETALLSYVNYEKEIAESLTIKDGGFVNIYSKTNTETKRMILGDTNQNGEVTITFKTRLISLTIEAQAQYSAYQRYWDEYDENLNIKPQGYIIDNKNTANVISINNTEWDLEYNKFGESVYQTQEESDANLPEIKTRKFDIYNKKLVLKGFKSKRVNIYKLTFEVEK